MGTPTPNPTPTQPPVEDPLAKYRGKASTEKATTAATPTPAADPLAKYRGKAAAPVAPAATPAKPAAPATAPKARSTQLSKFSREEQKASLRSRNPFQDLLDALGSPQAFFTGASEYATRPVNDMPAPTEEQKTNPFAQLGYAFGNVGKIIEAGNKNVTAPWEGRERKYWGDSLKNVYGDYAGREAAGLAMDLILDPLNIAGGVGAVTKAIKGAVSAGKVATKAGILSTKGLVPVALSGGRAVADAVPEAIQKAPTFIKQITKSDESIKMANASSASLTQNALKVVPVAEQSVAQKLLDFGASTAVGAYKGLLFSLEKSVAKENLLRLGKYEAKVAKKAERVAKKAAKGADYVAPGINAAEDVANVAEDVIAKQPEPIRPVDSEPLSTNAQIIPDTPQELSIAQKLLEDANAVAKKTRATLPDAATRSAKVLDILNTVVKPVGNSIPAELRATIANAVKDPEAISLQAVITNKFGEGAAKMQAAMDSIAKHTFIAETGATVALGSVFRSLREGKKTFAQYSAADQDAIRAAIEGAIAVKPVASEQGILKQLSDLVGEKASRELLSTGAVKEGLNEKNSSAVYDILKALPTAKTRGYKSAAEMIDGIQNGDKISPTALLNLLKAMDPQNALLEEAAAAVKTPEGIKAIQSALISKGRNTIALTERRLNALNPETLLNSDNIPFSDAAIFAADRALQGISATEPLILAETRKTAMASMENLERGETGALVRSVLDSMGRGLREQFGRIVKLMDDPATLVHENIAGRIAVSKLDDSGAVIESYLPEYFSQYVETKIWASIVAKGSTMRDYARAKSVNSKLKLPEFESRFKDVARNYDVLRVASLATFGTRLVNVRAVREANKVENLYNVYTDFGDFAEAVLRAANSGDAALAKAAESANKAFFPVDSGVRTGNKARKEFRVENSFSPQGVGRAVNKLLESMDKGKEYSKAEMVKDILSRGKNDKREWSKGFKDASVGWASDIADLLVAEKKFFADRHTTRMLAEIEDMTRPAHIMAADLFMPLLEAARAYAQEGLYTFEQRSRMVTDALNKFAIGSDLFAQQSGHIAVTAFRSAARIFITAGGIEDAVKLSTIDDLPRAARFLRAASLMKPGEELAPEFQKFLDGINTYSLSVDNTASLVTKVSKDARLKISKDLTDAESAYAELALKLAKPAEGANIAELNRLFKKAQKALDNIRGKAVVAGLPVRHWSNQKLATGAPDGWVDAAHYNKAEEEAFLSQNLAQTAADAAASAKPKVKMSKAEKEALRAAQAKQNLSKVEDLIAQGEDDVVADIKQIEEMYPGDEIEQGMRMIDEMNSTVARDAVIHTDEAMQFAIKDYIYPTTNAGRRAMLKNGEAVPDAGRLERIGEVLNPLNETRGLARALYNSLESRAMNSTADVHNHLRLMMKAFGKKKVTSEQYSAAFELAVSGMKTRSSDEMVNAIAHDLHLLMDAAIAKLKSINVDPKMLSYVLRKHGITPDNGFVDVAELEDPADIFTIFEKMPFSPKPDFDLLTVEGREASARWDDRAKTYEKYISKQKGRGSGGADTAFSVFAKTIDSIQFSVMQEMISKEMVARFNYLAEGKTMEQAISEGYVRMIGGGSGFSFFKLDGLDAVDGNLFHPDIAKSIAWLNREHNVTFNGKNLWGWAQGVLQATQLVKSTQTILRPGHWFTNLGDYITAMTTGTLNPQHWGQAAEIAGAFANRNLKADYRNFDQLSYSLERALGSLDGMGGRAFRSKEKADKGEKTYQFVIGGKAMNIPQSELIKLMKDHNILAGDVHVNDSALLYQEIAAHTGGKGGKSAAMAKLSNGFNNSKLGVLTQKALKPSGDFVAYTGNIPRVAHALKTMQGRNWGSLKEALEAANDTLSRYHPMNQSLSAVERKTARVAFSYYTWLKVAHQAVAHMMLNHTAAMMIPPKIFYAMSEASGQNPQSVGNLWGDKSTTPEYIDNSVYGPTMNGARGPMVWRPPIMQMDVADTWDISIDPTLSPDENLWKNVNSVTTNLFGMGNMLLQPVGQVITKTNPSTGAPEEITSTAQFLDKYLQMIGYTGALAGLGIYTPYQQEVNKKKGKTPEQLGREQELKRLNYTFGQKLMDVNTPSTMKNGATEEKAHAKRVAEILAQRKKEQNK